MSEERPPRLLPQEGSPSTTEWRRVLALFLMVLALSVAQASVLVGIPLVALVLVVPTGRLSGLVAGALAAVLAFGGAPREALWYAERGWAILLGGWFAALTLRWPGARFFPRALGAVAGALAVTAVVLISLDGIEQRRGPVQAIRPRTFETVDWLVSDRMRSGVTAAVSAIGALQGPIEGGDSPAEGAGETGESGGERSGVVRAIYQAVDFQVRVFPALLGLASLAALGVAWWLYVRFAHGVHGALGPAREFRFNDHLVWLFIVGLVLLLIGQGEAWTRTGSNAVVFMGALYALRGAAVVMFMSGGLSLMGAVLVGLGLLFVAPVILVAALVIGLGDTWLDLRGRARQQSA